MEWGDEVWLYIFGAISTAIVFITKFILKLFKAKNKEIKKLTEEKHCLEIQRARIEGQMVKKFKSRGKRRE